MSENSKKAKAKGALQRRSKKLRKKSLAKAGRPAESISLAARRRKWRSKAKWLRRKLLERKRSKSLGGFILALSKCEENNEMKLTRENLLSKKLRNIYLSVEYQRAYRKKKKRKLWNEGMKKAWNICTESNITKLIEETTSLLSCERRRRNKWKY